MEKASQSESRPHTERWAYRWLYNARIFAFASAFYGLLGRRGFHVVTRAVARLYTATQPAITGIVRRNLALLGGEPTRGDAEAVFLNYATVLADYVAVGAMSDPHALALCGAFEGREHLESAMKGGKGVILATGHLGFFEFGVVVLGSLGLPVTVATLPEPSSRLTAWRAKWRSRWGCETVEVGADPFSSLGVNRALAAGRLVALLADRPISDHGIEVSVPGGRTLFSTTPAMLSFVSGAPVVPVVVTRREDGRYRLAAFPAIRAERRGNDSKHAEIARSTHAIADALFQEIANYPEQWFQFVPVQCD